MFALSRAPLQARSAAKAATLCAVSALMLGLGACAKSPPGPQVFAWSLLAEPQAVQRPAPAVATEVEDDGLPAQAAPPMRIRQVPDDPQAPWSRNYGGPSEPPRSVAADEPPLAEPSAEPALVSRGENGDDGYPVPMGPEEAGVLPSATGPAPGSRRCWKTGGGWMCSR